MPSRPFQKRARIKLSVQEVRCFGTLSAASSSRWVLDADRRRRTAGGHVGHLSQGDIATLKGDCRPSSISHDYLDFYPPAPPPADHLEQTSDCGRIERSGTGLKVAGHGAQIADGTVLDHDLRLKVVIPQQQPDSCPASERRDRVQTASERCASMVGVCRKGSAQHRLAVAPTHDANAKALRHGHLRSQLYFERADVFRHREPAGLTPPRQQALP